jgi:hypothetical protein
LELDACRLKFLKGVDKYLRSEKLKQRDYEKVTGVL